MRRKMPPPGCLLKAQPVAVLGLFDAQELVGWGIALKVSEDA